MTTRMWMLLVFLTLGMHGMYQRTDLTVTDVNHGMVTLQGKDSVYQIEQAEAWRKGDNAEAITADGKLIEVRWKR